MSGPSKQGHCHETELSRREISQLHDCNLNFECEFDPLNDFLECGRSNLTPGPSNKRKCTGTRSSDNNYSPLWSQPLVGFGCDVFDAEGSFSPSPRGVETDQDFAFSAESYNFISSIERFVNSMFPLPAISSGKETPAISDEKFSLEGRLLIQLRLPVYPRTSKRNNSTIRSKNSFPESLASTESCRKPGENIPGRASNLRTTISSRGSENYLSSRSQAKIPTVAPNFPRSEPELAETSSQFDLSLDSIGSWLPTDNLNASPNFDTRTKSYELLGDKKYETDLQGEHYNFCDLMNFSAMKTSASAAFSTLDEQNRSYSTPGNPSIFSPAILNYPQHEVSKECSIVFPPESFEYAGSAVDVQLSDKDDGINLLNEFEPDYWDMNIATDAETSQFALLNSHISSNQRVTSQRPIIGVNPSGPWLNFGPFTHLSPHRDGHAQSPISATSYSTIASFTPQISEHSGGCHTEPSPLLFSDNLYQTNHMAASSVIANEPNYLGTQLISTASIETSQLNSRFRSLEGSSQHRAPILVVTEDTNETQAELQEILEEANQKPRLRRASSIFSPRKVSTHWEHHFVLDGRFEQGLSSGLQPKKTASTGRRRRPLDEESKEKASELRKIGSCWYCRISKMSCSLGLICDQCQKAAASPLTKELCSRVPLREYTELFLPDLSIRKFQPAWINKVIQDDISSFTGNIIPVQITSGVDYPPFALRVHEFSPVDGSILAWKTLVESDNGNAPSYRISFSPPVGLDMSDTASQDIAAILNDHMQTIVKGERSYGEVLWGFTSQLSWDVYEAIHAYQNKKPNRFIRTALRLFTMQYFMNAGLGIRPESHDEILKQLKRPQRFIYSPDAAACLLNYQIKQVMCTLIRTTYAEVLDGLERELRSKSIESWATCFSIIMILRMCAEMVQTNADARITRAVHDGEILGSRADIIVEISRKLDDLPVAYSTAIFHAVHKTQGPKRGNRREKGLNPLQCEDIIGGEKIAQSTIDFVRKIRDIMAKHDRELENMAKPPHFSDENDLEDHIKFRRENSGRLVADFLKSFLQR